MTTSTSPTSSGSSADVTSSKSITCGCIISARAIATRCCCPPESWCGCWTAFSSSPTTLSSSWARPSARARGSSDPPGGERQVVDHLQMREEVELLEDHADPLAQAGDIDPLAGDLLALELDRARVERLQQVDAAEQRALAAARAADDDQHLARGDLEVDAVQHQVVAETLAHLAQAQRGHALAADADLRLDRGSFVVLTSLPSSPFCLQAVKTRARAAEVKDVTARSGCARAPRPARRRSLRPRSTTSSPSSRKVRSAPLSRVSARRRSASARSASPRCPSTGRRWCRWPSGLPCGRWRRSRSRARAAAASSSRGRARSSAR